MHDAIDDQDQAQEPGEPRPDPPANAGLPSPTDPLQILADERLDPRVVPYWLTSGLFGNGIFAALSIGALLAFGGRLPATPAIQWSLVLSLIAVQVLWTLVSAPLSHRVWRFRIDDQLLVARYGIIIRQEKVIPTNRLQHVDLVRGPIERLFGLATLVVHTAGTEAVAFRLPGLAIARAQELRDHILRARGVDVV